MPPQVVEDLVGLQDSVLEVLIILWFAEIAENLTFVDTLYCIVDVTMAVQQNAKYRALRIGSELRTAPRPCRACADQK